MARKPRVYIPGIPSHVVQRGVDRSVTFFTDDDYHFYLTCLDEARQRYDVAVHAYVLMTNHVHLLMTPSTTDGISRVMQLVGNRYVQYINKTYRRTGTLWEGRHKSSLIDADNYLLSCYRYIELNPVRAGMVEDPLDYPWSSFQHHAAGVFNPIIEDHVVFKSLSMSVSGLQNFYREFCYGGVHDDEVSKIRRSVGFSKVLGGKRFESEIDSILKRQLSASEVT